MASGYDYAIGNVSRFDDAVGYDTPSIAGFRGSLMLRTGNATVTTAEAGGPLDGGDALSASLTYANGPLFAAASYLTTRPSASSSLVLRGGNLVATYDFGLVKLHALGFYTNRFNEDRYFSYALGMSVPLGALAAISSLWRLDW